MLLKARWIKSLSLTITILTVLALLWPKAAFGHSYVPTSGTCEFSNGHSHSLQVQPPNDLICVDASPPPTGSNATANPALGTVQFPAGFSLNSSKILNNLVGVFIAVGGLVFFFMLLFGGIKFMTAGGDPKNAEAARKTITNAVIGLIIVVSAFLVTTVLGELLGIPFLKPVIPGL